MIESIEYRGSAMRSRGRIKDERLRYMLFKSSHKALERVG